MSTQSIPTWILTATTRLQPSQSETLAVLVAAAIRTARPDRVQIGRTRAGPITAEGATKRAGRFTCNARAEASDARAEVIARPVRKRTKRLPVGSDRAEFRRPRTLLAAAGIRGRSVPLLRAGDPEWELLRSPNSPEEGPLRLSRTLIPETVRVVIPAARGGGRAE